MYATGPIDTASRSIPRAVRFPLGPFPTSLSGQSTTQSFCTLAASGATQETESVLSTGRELSPRSRNEETKVREQKRARRMQMNFGHFVGRMACRPSGRVSPLSARPGTGGVMRRRLSRSGRGELNHGLARVLRRAGRSPESAKLLTSGLRAERPFELQSGARDDEPGGESPDCARAMKISRAAGPPRDN